jgi:hypothetical protein
MATREWIAKRATEEDGHDVSAGGSALLPTSTLAVEAWLRTLANPSDLLKLRENGDSEYPYLFGMAVVKLAEAHAEYLRLLERQAAKKGRR